MRTITSVARPSIPAVRKHSLTSAPNERTRQPNYLVQTAALIDAHRLYGYRGAALNPLDTTPPDLQGLIELRPETYGFARHDHALHLTVELAGVSRTLTIEQLLSFLRSCYCSSLAINSEHVRKREQREWFYARMERAVDVPSTTDADRVRVLEQLCAAEIFEQYLATRHAKQKRFNLQGSEGIVPLLDAITSKAISRGVDNLILGMQHRGRLNLMKNVLGVPADQILSLFSDTPSWPEYAWDLSDHLGYSTVRETPHGSARILLAHNPSHLESVSPVVCGMARALQDRRGDDAKLVLPVLLHGDAAFCGQGIVTETLNLSQTRGYHVGGTIHVILNNQIGSTVSHPRDARSSQYCADVGRSIDAPILHVNADDPEATYFAAELAVAYRMEFAADVIVDLIGYRRYGHNSCDEAALTQPAMQGRICNHPSVVDLYARRLIQRELVTHQQVTDMRCAAWEAMCDAESETTRGGTPVPGRKSGSDARETNRGVSVTTAVPLSHLQTLLQRLSDVPPTVVIHKKLEALLAGWRNVARKGDAQVDWCIAENLAYATLLDNGFSIRLTGMDVGRGSFYHRHAVWHDQRAETDGVRTYYPLRHIAKGQGYFSIYDTPLSEEAVLGFEYGYAAQCGRDIVLWEAQMGDFVNNAQVIIDQYISCGTAKWGYRNGLVLLLPHGYEGVGPEHSSASVGRFLSLCADDNMRVVMPTSSAQLFHMLRRHALAEERRPLVVITGKMCLLGQRMSHSRMTEFANGQFYPMLQSPVDIDAAGVTRAIVTCGKLYYDLDQARTEAKRAEVVILRVEELYPFPRRELAARLAHYPQLREVVWAQEEARNHGAWHFVREELESALPAGVSLAYVGRPAAAASAVCNAAQHAAEQRAVVDKALGVHDVFLESR